MDHSAMPRIAKIEWLLLDKFSDWSSEDLLIKASNDFVFNENEEYLSYSTHLYGLDEEALHDFFVSRLETRKAVALTKRTIGDAILFFNKPGAFADITFWSKQLTWTIEQTIALSMSRDPDRVNSITLLSEENEAADSAFAREYIARLRIAASFESVGQLEALATPGERLAWLQRAGLSAPDELKLAVQQMGHVIADWYSEYHRVEAENEELQSGLQELRELNWQWQQRCADLIRSHQAELEERDRELHESQMEIDDLYRQIAEAADTPERGSREAQNDNALDIRRYKSALKIISAMARQKYNMGKPGERGRSTTSRIESAANLEGIKISDKTIRSILRDAEELSACTGK